MPSPFASPSADGGYSVHMRLIGRLLSVRSTCPPGHVAMSVSMIGASPTP